MLIRLVVFCLEVALRIVLAIAEGLRDSPVVRHSADLLVESVSTIVTRVLQKDSVKQAVAKAVAEGLNAFLEQPNLDQHIRSMAASVSKSQPDLARQHGQDFPVIVGSFLQGMLQGKPFLPKNNEPKLVKDDENAAIGQLTPQTQPEHRITPPDSAGIEQPSSSPATAAAAAPNKMLNLLSFPTLGGAPVDAVVLTPKKRTKSGDSSHADTASSSPDHNPEAYAVSQETITATNTTAAAAAAAHSSAGSADNKKEV